MSRSRKLKRQSSSAAAVVDAPRNTDHAAVGPFLLMGGSGFQAAGQDPARGYIYWPTTDTRRQITSWTRHEVARKIQFLYNHFGFIRRLVNGLATMLGYLTPQPTTSDEKWNELAFESFMSIAGSAQVWDMAGKFDFFSGQLQDNISIFRDADVLCVKTMTAGGRARMAYYESHQLANPPETGTDWVDGVQIYRGRHIAYGVKDGEDPSQITVVPAWKCIYMTRFENRGQVRPLSILAAAVLNMQDVIETRGYNKHAIKSASRFGTVIETDAVATAPTTIPGAPGSGASVSVPIKKADGTTAVINMEAVFAGAQTPPLAPGQKMKVITDDRPSMNNQLFEEALLKDCCYTVGVSYERLCNLAGLTGPALRTLNSDEKRWVKLNHYDQSKRVHNQVIYTLALEMAAGRLREPKLRPGEQWTQSFQYIGLAASDIDGGRTAAATLTDLKSGQTTWLETWGQKGVYWKRAIKQAVAEPIFVICEIMRQAKAAGLPDGMVQPEWIFPERFSKDAKPALPNSPDLKVNPDAIDGNEPDPQNETEPAE
jgi:hypothetical protein